MPDKQLLHLVFGGELKDVTALEFRDLTKIEFVGAYPNYAEAHRAWKSKAQSKLFPRFPVKGVQGHAGQQQGTELRTQ